MCIMENPQFYIIVLILHIPLVFTENFVISEDFIFQQSSIKYINPEHYSYVKQIDFSSTRNAISTLHEMSNKYKQYCETLNSDKQHKNRYGNLEIFTGTFTSVKQQQNFCDTIDAHLPELRTNFDVKNIMMLMNNKQSSALANVVYDLRQNKHVCFSIRP